MWSTMCPLLPLWFPSIKCTESESKPLSGSCQRRENANIASVRANSVSEHAANTTIVSRWDKLALITETVRPSLHFFTFQNESLIYQNIYLIIIYFTCLLIIYRRNVLGPEFPNWGTRTTNHLLGKDITVAKRP